MSDEAGLGGSRASLDEIVADLVRRAEHGDAEAARGPERDHERPVA